MSVNLLDLVKGQFNGPLVAQIGQELGADERSVSGAIDGAIPTILAGLVKQGSDEKGASALTGLLGGLDLGFLDNLGSAFSKGGGLLSNLGGDLLGGLLGNQLGSITDLLGKATGLAGGKMGSLLKMLAPVVFGVLAKQTKLLGLGGKGLLDLLLSQRKFLKGMLPDGIGDALGVSKLLASTDSPAATAAPAPEGGSLLGKLVPLALIAGLGYFSYTKFIAPDNEVQAQGESMAEGLPSDGELLGLLDQVGDSIESVTDADSASAVLPALQEQGTKVTELLGSFGDLPSLVQDNLGGSIQGALPGLKAKVDQAFANDGVREVLEPALGPLLEKLQEFGG